MNVDDLREAMKANNIKDHACLIYPSVGQQLSYCLVNDNWWFRVYLNEKGEFLVDRWFATEDDACRFVFRKMLENWYWRNDWRSIDPAAWPTMRRELLTRNSFDPNEKVPDIDDLAWFYGLTSSL